jgi:hypothetical protein
MLEQLSRRREGRSRRVSSWDRSGKNGDYWPVEPGETKTLADVSGAGVIRHLWFTIGAEDPNYLRQCVVRMYWDGMDRPSVEAPVGDFFGVGHSRVSSYSCAVLNMSANAGDSKHAAMNCYFPMPFSDGARITVENQGEKRVGSWYFYVDYDELPRLAPEELRFHAWWNRENPCTPASDQQQGDWDVNLTDRDNYLFMEAKGYGHFVGANLSVHNLCGGWWGEGDDMFMIDGQKWPPELHGTGSEDWYNQAWGSQPANAFLYNGVSFHKGTHNHYNERITVYRYQVCEPIIFHESLRASIEHGHANDRADDYSSVAYWYQTLPHAPFPPLPAMEARLPRADVAVQPANLPIRPGRKVSGSPFDPELR